ncbi:MAG TPA: flavin reductase family protein [Elusimicrobiota bacterium]|nr:flavin reductase family protein [Elusimicrobiota bacterium]
MFKRLAVGEFYHLLGFGPCVLITSGDEKRGNVAPIAWTTPVNDDPALAGIVVAETHYTTELILRKKQFVINVPPLELLKPLKFCGSVSGRKGDKFAKTGLRLERGVKVRTPHLKDAIAFIECALLWKRNFGGVYLFVGKVLHAAAEKSCYKNGVLTARARTFHHLAGGSFALTGRRVSA